MKSVAFATCREVPALTASDLLAARQLQKRAIQVEAVVWDDPKVRGSAFDCVVVRCTWDYHRYPGQFVSW